MRLPAYGKALLKAREAGATPWVVVVALGHIVDAQTLRGQQGVARIGLPFDFPLDTGDLALLRGLDVLVSCFRPETMTRQAAQLWHRMAMDALEARGETGLIWCVDAAGRSASAIQRFSARAGSGWAAGWPRAVPLDGDFREELAWWRKCALLAGSGVFARPAFDRVRERVRSELAGGHGAH